MYITSKSYFHDQVVTSIQEHASTSTSPEADDWVIPMMDTWDNAEIVWKVKLNGFDYKTMTNLKYLARFLTTHETLTHKDSLLKTGLRVMGPAFNEYHPPTKISPEIPNFDTQKGKNLKKEPKGWIVKPTDGFNGRGIRFYWKRYLLMKDLRKANRPLIVQQYISNPLLLDGKKLDIRMYILLTPDRILVHQRGYVRTAPHRYISSSTSRNVHLTNTAVHNDNDGHNLKPLDVLEKYGISKDLIYEFIRKLKPLFEHAQNVESERRRYEDVKFETFELLGLDIIFDNNLKPWLLEINADPGVKSVGFYREIAPQVINDTLRETIFKHQNKKTEFMPI